MDMKISFPGGQKVAADYKGFTILTDQPESYGGENAAPSPFDLFLASIGTCAGYYVLNFCEQRKIDPQGIELTAGFERDPESKLVTKVTITIQLPDAFPAQYHDAVIRAASSCLVKKHLANPPQFEIEVV